MSQPSVAIVILNWNGKHHLQQFLPSVIQTTYPNLRIIVADNASSDDSVDFLQEHFPQVEILRLQKNFGFAKGYNEALKHVEADYYVLLNSDVEVTAGWLEPIITLLEEQPIHGACQPKVLAHKNKNFFEYAGAGGGWLDAYGYPFARGRIFDICEADNGQYNTTEEVFWATGAAMVIRSQVYHQLNGFDEYFFAHQEEIDLWIPYRLALDQVSAVKGLLSGDGGYFLSIIESHLAFLYWIFFGSRKWKPKNKRKITSLQGVYKGNLVWQHFILKKKTFLAIVERKKNSD
ncbi:MAG: glycosyltransferase family 2 protein [Chitinophagaceae bacterium]|nr:MAG: glycosyltransferase family 2 protein [Chitinophagaceae bacterium]